MKKELLEWAKSLAIALVIVFVFNIFATFTTVYNTSMFPTLVEKDLLFIIKGNNYNRGDIVSFESELEITESDLDGISFFKKLFNRPGDHKNLIKRIIAVPGDTIEVKDGQVFLNGELLDEPYVSSETIKNCKYEDIAEGYYFLMGDNRQVSLDSRYESVGLVAEDKMIGKNIFRVFPFNRIGTL